MGSVLVRFYAELGDLLPREKRGGEFHAEFSPGRTVKDLIEGLGVPHTEVDLVLVDGVTVDFSHPLGEGERVAVFPMFESFDISGLSRVRMAPLRETRFVADVHLGRLAAYLRLAGFDTLYRNDWSDEEVVEAALPEHRIVLTRDRGLLKRSAVTHGYLIRETDSRRQLAEVVDRFDLSASLSLFSRCSVCNGIIRAVAKSEVAGKIPAATARTCQEFSRCETCGRIYWEGTHYRAISGLLASLGPGEDRAGA